MKLALIFLAVLPLILASPVEEKRFLEFLHLNSLVDQLKGVLQSGTGKAGCVVVCQGLAGALSFLCGQACDLALNALGK